MTQTSQLRIWAVAFTTVVAVGCGDDTTSTDDTSGQTTATSSSGSGQGGASTTSASSTSSATGTGGAEPMAPIFRNPVNLPDDELAAQALALLGAGEEPEMSNRCVRCHSLTASKVHQWADLTKTAMTDCITDVTVPSKQSAEDILACIRKKPGVDTSPFTPQKLGVVATAADLDWFKFVFDRVYGTVDGPVQQKKFRARAGMPKGNATAFTQADFDVVAEWFARDVPLVDDLLPDDPPPGNCMPHIDAQVATVVDDLALTGWRAENGTNGLLMYGCAGAANALGCLTSYPLSTATPASDTWAYLSGTTARILRVNDYESSYWTRSSADGRYVGHGGGTVDNATIIDLMDDQLIPVNAFYDPAFFPDNSGFVFQNMSAGICRQTLLDTATQVTFAEPECTSTNAVGLYEHVGAALGGGDYWTVHGWFVSDDGGHVPTLSDPDAQFGGNGAMVLTPLVYDGSNYDPGPQAVVDTPFEGDSVLSPSTRLVISRRAGSGFTQRGFVLREVIATPVGNGYNVDAPEIARYCVNGGKPGFSYDERWAVYHHYVQDADAQALGFTGPDDPAFQAYRTAGASNVYLLDILTGNVVRVTHMKPGQYALYPHFRSDGWIYYLVREAAAGTETIVASDAALVQENL